MGRKKSFLIEMINTCRRELGKESESRVRELFRDFGGLELHHTKLPKFTEVEQRVINDNEFDMVAREGEHYWIAEVKSGKINETDMNRFVEKLDKIGYTLKVLGRCQYIVNKKSSKKLNTS
jgi:hypothetical protein